ncbi:MAG: hypothetical protein FWF06_08765 [Symbiobacteriaceae bacterium]|nr:hypothetical protein [Symbiobacteriaceae bacterium]
MEQQSIWHKLGKLDHRIIYLIFTILVGYPLIFPIGLPLPISDSVRSAYEIIGSFPAGSTLYMGCELGATNAPEMRPMFVAIMRYTLSLNHKVILAGFWEDGPTLVSIWMEALLAESGAIYGEDFVNIGYRARGSMQAILEQARHDFISAFSDRDMSGKVLSSMPIMQGITKVSDLDYVVILNPGSPGTEAYISAWRATGAVSTIIDCPSSNQITIGGYNLQAGLTQGMIGGLNGAAQFEALIKKPYKGISGMDAQGLGHLGVIFFLALGNLSYFQTKRRDTISRGE